MSISVEKANKRLCDAHAGEILAWAVDRFAPDVAMSSSFQTQSLPLLHLVSRVAPDLEILFLDTGFHFPETVAFRDRLIREWGLNVRNLRRQAVHSSNGGAQTPDLYRADPDFCCHMNKVEPMRLATEGLTAWISGIRRDQSEARRDITVVEETGEGLMRIHPMANWSSKDVFQYIADHDLPKHPLLAEGYLTVGCAPCTRPAADGGGERSGRWVGRSKNECGLHTELREQRPVSISPPPDREER